MLRSDKIKVWLAICEDGLTLSQELASENTEAEEEGLSVDADDGTYGIPYVSAVYHCATCSVDRITTQYIADYVGHGMQHDNTELTMWHLISILIRSLLFSSTLFCSVLFCSVHYCSGEQRRDHAGVRYIESSRWSAG